MALVQNFARVPVIGSGPNAFSDIGQQLAYWDRRNVGVTSDNIARLNAVQQYQNDYFKQLAAQRQQAMDRDMQMQLQADAEARQRQDAQAAVARDQAATERAYNFSAAQENARLAAENSRTKAMTDIRSMAQSDRMAKEAEKIDQTGQNFARNYGGYQSELQSAKDSIAKLENERKDLAARQAALTQKQNSAGYFSGGLSGEEKTELASLPSQISAIDKQLAPTSPANRALLAAQKKLSGAEVTMQNSGFALDPSNNHIVHAPTGKRWSYSPDMTGGDDSQGDNYWSQLDDGDGSDASQGAPNLTPVSTPAPQPVQPPPGNNYFSGTASASPATNTVTKRWVRGPGGTLILAQ